MNNIQFVTGLHGDEKLPIVALASIGVKQIVANPLALAKNKRFIEKDMNSSFGTNGDSYEEKMAIKLARKLNKSKYIVDLHTNQSMDEPFSIVIDKNMIFLASMLGIEKVVYMKYNIKKGCSLIDRFDGVAVEVGKHDSYGSVKNTIKIVENLKKRKSQKITLYEVFGRINRPGEYVNFTMHKDGFIPLFAGKNSYGCFGLKARIIKKYE